MNSEIPTVDQLRAMLALHEERAKVQRQLEAIDAKLTAFQSQIFSGGPQRQPKRTAGAGASAAEQKPVARTPAGAAPAKAERNVFKGRVTEALATVGEAGASLKELAEKLGTNYRNLAVWFATTGKKNPRIVKVGPARYRLSADADPTLAAPESALPSPTQATDPAPDTDTPS